MKGRNIFIILFLLILFIIFVYNIINYIRGYKLNYGIGIKICEATMIKEGDLSSASEYSYEQLNSSDKPTVLQFAYHDRGTDVDFESFYCVLGEDKVIKYIDGGDVLLGQGPVSLICFVGDINTKEIQLNDEQFTQIVEGVKEITKICKPANKNDINSIYGGQFEVFYYGNSFYNYDISRVKEIDNAKRKAVHDTYHKLRDILADIGDK